MLVPVPHCHGIVTGMPFCKRGPPRVFCTEGPCRHHTVAPPDANALMCVSSLTRTYFLVCQHFVRLGLARSRKLLQIQSGQAVRGLQAQRSG